MPFSTYFMDAERNVSKDLDREEIRRTFESQQGLLWVDITDPTEDDGQLLEQVFDFHRLAVHDCVSRELHSPKIDDLNTYLFIVVHGVNNMSESNLVETTELALFLGKHFVVTSHNVPLYSVQGIRQAVEEDGRPMKRGADFLAHALIDALIDNVIPTVDAMAERAEEIEEEILQKPVQSTLEHIMQLKRSALRLRRVMTPQRELMNRLSRHEFSLISQEAHMFYADIHDHIVRIEDLSQSLVDRADNSLATYLSSVANRQNETMKLLAIMATIFMPLTLLAGIYGMNFEHMPELSWSWSYYAVVGIIATGIIVAFWVLWARKWLPFVPRKAMPVRPFSVERERLVGYMGHVKKWRHFDASEG
jgi:magnesium transporter